MIKIHENATRGRTRTGWLDSFHTFAFGGFNDPTRLGFGNLRVLNDDRIISGSGFAPHRHADMDILTLVLSGCLRHEDSQGNISVIRTGQAQLLAAGEGIEHGEWNGSESENAHFLQIWMIPDTRGGPSRYLEATIPDARDTLLAGPAGSGAHLTLRSNATIRLVHTIEDETLSFGVADGKVYVHLVEGLAMAESERLSGGDGLQIPAGETVTLSWRTAGLVLVFTMPDRGF